MERFKADNVKDIEEEKVKHAARTKAELERIAADEATKCAADDATLDKEDERTEVVSPSQATELS